MQSLLWIQTLLIFAGTGFSYYYMSNFDALSAAYGGGIALFSSLILARRTTRAIKSASEGSLRSRGSSSAEGSRQVMALLYMGVLQRYVFVLLGLGIGLGLLKLNAKPMLIVFGIAQLAYFMPWLGSSK